VLKELLFDHQGGSNLSAGISGTIGSTFRAVIVIHQRCDVLRADAINVRSGDISVLRCFEPPVCQNPIISRFTKALNISRGDLEFGTHIGDCLLLDDTFTAVSLFRRTKTILVPMCSMCINRD
jgi:hypothetical protein